MKNPTIQGLLLAIIIFGAIACNTYFHSFRSNYDNANSLIHETKNLQTKPFLKAHLKNGDVCILQDTWVIDTAVNTVSGTGSQFDFNRRLVYQGALTIQIDSVAIFETNTKLQNTEAERIRALSILAGLDLGLGLVCISNPKACFGSCPTFYFDERDNFHYADAEGFSNAISPSMEYFDIDALNTKTITGNTLDLTMKNEALETHCVKSVNLLSYPIQDGERVFQSPNNTFYLCEKPLELVKAHGPEGNITELLQKEDRLERFSLSDEHNLSSKEELILDFDNLNSSKDLGLVLNFRQSLMTTYFIYSAIGYMGDQVGDIFAKLETDKSAIKKLNGGLKKELGNVDIYVWNESTKSWVYQDGFYETGPIAINRQIIPLQAKEKSQKLKVKLVLNKGLWRLDYAAIAPIKKEVEPLEIQPIQILNKGKKDHKALTAVLDTAKHLISMPGDEYNFQFRFPHANTRYELFLYSKGYYIEWMRESWLQDKNLLKLRQLLENPKKYLRVEAANYKRYETTMEQQFWNSKVDTKSFSYYEN
ncbi:MAG: hypothetical protein EP332_06880 [Bacteroidetes bacterium]|nr:MAG: hypothetical protein EP332_06880 [Bacteroidota bacterium]